jgi:hypothetical protein
MPINKKFYEFIKGVTVLFDPLCALVGVKYFPVGVMPCVFEEYFPDLSSVNLVIDHPKSYIETVLKSRCLEKLARKGYNVPITIFRERKDSELVRLVITNSVRDVTIKEAYECMCATDSDKFVVKPSLGGAGALVEFQDLSPESFKDAVSKSPPYILQQFIHSKERTAQDYRFVVVGNEHCAEYSRKSGEVEDMTNLALGGIPEKITDTKLMEELGALSEKITMEFDPPLQFASVDFLNGRDGIVVGEVHRFGLFNWDGYIRLYSNDEKIQDKIDFLIKKNLGDGKISWISSSEVEFPLEYWTMKFRLFTKFPYKRY